MPDLKVGNTSFFVPDDTFSKQVDETYASLKPSLTPDKIGNMSENYIKDRIKNSLTSYAAGDTNASNYRWGDIPLYNAVSSTISKYGKSFNNESSTTNKDAAQLSAMQMSGSTFTDAVARDNASKASTPVVPPANGGTVNAASVPTTPTTPTKLPSTFSESDLNFNATNTSGRVLTADETKGLQAAWERAQNNTANVNDRNNIMHAVNKGLWKPIDNTKTVPPFSVQGDITQIEAPTPGKGSDTTPLAPAPSSDEGYKQLNEMATKVGGLTGELAKSMTTQAQIAQTKEDAALAAINKATTELGTVNEALKADYASIAIDKAKIDANLTKLDDSTTQLQALMTTINVETPNGTVPTSILARQNAGKASGLLTVINVIKGNITTATSVMSTYYSERRLNLATQADNLKSVLVSQEAIRSDYAGERQDRIKSALTVIEDKIKSDRENEKLILGMITQNPQAYSQANISPDDDQNTILTKFGNAANKIKAMENVLSKYPDAKVNASMSLEEMANTLETSALYKADLAEKMAKATKTGEMSDAQKLARADRLIKEYARGGRALDLDQALQMVDSGQKVDMAYNVGFYDKMRSDIAKTTAGMTPNEQMNYITRFDDAIQTGNVDSAINVINDAAYMSMAPGQKTEYDLLQSTSSGLNTAISYTNRYAAGGKSMGIFTKYGNELLTKINVDKDPEIVQTQAMIAQAQASYIKFIYGTSLSGTELEKANMFNVTPTDTLKTAIDKLYAQKNYVAQIQSQKLTQHGGIEMNDEMSGVLNKYKSDPGLKAQIDMIYANNPNSSAAEVNAMLQKVNNSGEKGTGIFNVNPAFKYDQTYVDAVSRSFQYDKVMSPIVTKYPQASQGGQCGSFAKSITNRDYSVGDLYTSKQATVDTKGQKKENLSISNYKPGQTLIFDAPETTDENGNPVKYGHVAVINDVNTVNGTITLTESNIYGNEKVTHDRTIIMKPGYRDYDRLYGVLPTQFK